MKNIQNLNLKYNFLRSKEKSCNSIIMECHPYDIMKEMTT